VAVDITFHYPPDLFNLLVDTVPRLCRSKKAVLLFFQGAGVERPLYADLERRLAGTGTISKYEIVRTVLTRLNEKGEATLRERRELLKRVVEFEEFETCWDSDRLEAKGLVAAVRKLVDVKDSFTRMEIERERERGERRKEVEQRQRQEEERKRKLPRYAMNSSSCSPCRISRSAASSWKVR
jgi:hypothetical protein